MSGGAVAARFFRANFLSQITNAQRRSVMVGGTFWLRDLAKTYRDGATTPANRKFIKAEFAELGIGADKLDAMVNFLADGSGLPDLASLETDVGQAWSDAISRFVDQTIMNPRRADKPMYASTAWGRLAYSLMSFSYTLFSNVHLATVNRAKHRLATARAAGVDAAGQAAAVAQPVAAMASTFALLWAGQAMVGMVRALMFNRDTWEEKEEDDELGAWLGWTAFSRTGLLGPGDVLLNTAIGLRYERDLTSLAVGAVPTWFMSGVQNVLPVIPGVGRNSPNNNTAEHKAAASAYGITAAPALNALMSVLPAPGPVSNTLRWGTMQYASSASAGKLFADVVVGEKGGR